MSEVPKGTKILDAVWVFKRKRDIKTRRVYKHKARLNVHGGQQQYGINNFDTYAPVVTWSSVRMILIKLLLHDWHTQQIDFMMAYLHAVIEHDLYMKLPKGVECSIDHGKQYILKLLKNIYGQKQARRV
eukprot:12036205-Ditylum_brightwellii.AAC.1